MSRPRYQRVEWAGQGFVHHPEPRVVPGDGDFVAWLERQAPEGYNLVSVEVGPETWPARQPTRVCLFELDAAFRARLCTEHNCRLAAGHPGPHWGVHSDGATCSWSDEPPRLKVDVSGAVQALADDVDRQVLDTIYPEVAKGLGGGALPQQGRMGEAKRPKMALMVARNVCPDCFADLPTGFGRGPWLRQPEVVDCGSCGRRVSVVRVIPIPTTDALP